MKVEAFARYGSRAASTRQRLLQYVPHLAAAGIEVKYHPLLGQNYVSSLATGASYSKTAILRSYAKRMVALARRPDADVIWIYAEAFPYLPAWFERLAFRSGKPVVVDFDDAFFHNYDAHPRAWVRALLKGKLEPLLRQASACCCGNPYLEDYASRFCRETMLLPTVVDTEIYRAAPRDRASGPLTIGWIGSPSTWSYMRPLLPILAELARERQLRIRIVGAGALAERDRFPGLDLLHWQEEREVADVQAMDIGVMPLPDEEWARGKSGYKLIQYMACGLPVVASPVGINSDIVRDGVNGYLATSPEEWRGALIRLIDDADLRHLQGAAGRARAVSDYSLAAHAPRFARLLTRLTQDDAPEHAARTQA